MWEFRLKYVIVMNISGDGDEDVCSSVQNGQQDIAMKALESLCENGRDEALGVTALRSVKTNVLFKLMLFINTVQRFSFR